MTPADIHRGLTKDFSLCQMRSYRGILLRWQGAAALLPLLKMGLEMRVLATLFALITLAASCQGLVRLPGVLQSIARQAMC